MRNLIRYQEWKVDLSGSLLRLGWAGSRQCRDQGGGLVEREFKGGCGKSGQRESLCHTSVSIVDSTP